VAPSDGPQPDAACRDDRPGSLDPALRIATLLDGYSVDHQVGYLLRRAHQRHAAIFQDGMAEADLTPTQFTALVKTVEAGRITQNHLGRLAGLAVAHSAVASARHITQATLAPLTQDERRQFLTLLRKLV